MNIFPGMCGQRPAHSTLRHSYSTTTPAISSASPHSTAPDDQLRRSCYTHLRQHSGRTLKLRSLHCFRSYLTLMDQKPLSKVRQMATTTFTNFGALPKAAHRNGCQSSYRGH